jgi:serine phosphatase RsbU (regulator of sigma subunit)/HAMP domain-containing protein
MGRALFRKGVVFVRSERMQVLWFRSLPFKLFLFMSAFLSLAILSVTWQNGKTFQNLLERQSEENTFSIARRSAASLSNGFAFWNSTVHSVMHAAATVDAEAEKKFIESLVTSNHDVVAFQAFDVVDGKNQERAFVFTKDVDNPGWRGTGSLEAGKRIREIGREFSDSKKPEGKGIVSVQNLFPQLRLPVMQIRIPFVTKVGSLETKSWAILSFWTSNLAVSLGRTDLLSTVVVDAKGVVVFDPKGEVSDDLKAPLEKDFLKGLADGGVAIRSEKGVSADGSPVLSVASRIPEVPLMVRLQKITRAEERQVAFQIRKILLWSMILFLVTVFVSFAVANRMTMRLHEVIRATSLIASGDFRSRIPVKAADEVGFLAFAVNSMAGSIQGLMAVRDNAVRQELELKTAEAIQKTLVPRSSGHENFVNSFGSFRAATECAGDWWGRFDMGEGRSLIAIADATGHGASSAIVAAVAYSFFASLQENCRAGKLNSEVDLVEVLGQLNSILWLSGQGACTLTMFVIWVDTKKGVIRYANGAHPFPFLLRVGEKVRGLTGGGSILGASSTVDFSGNEIHAKPGDRLVLFTDGLVECANVDGREAGRKRVRSMVMGVEHLHGEEFFASLQATVDDFFRGATLDDDVTIVVVEVDPSWPGASV